MGILVKQWLQEFQSVRSSQRHVSIAIRQFRFIGLNDYGVGVIIKLLPLLLQVALLLFFAGLPILLWSLDLIVAAVVTSLITVWLFAWVLSIILPTFRIDCPYKSAEAQAFLISSQYLKSVVPRMLSWAKGIYRNVITIDCFCQTDIEPNPQPGEEVEAHSESDEESEAAVSHSFKFFHTWREREQEHVVKAGRDQELCWKAIGFADENLMDDVIHITALHAYSEGYQDGDSTVKVANYAWEQIAALVGNGKLDNWEPDSSRATCALMDVAADLLMKYPFWWSDNAGQNLEVKEKLTLALGQYAFFRYSDAPDRDVIAKIVTLPSKVEFEEDFSLDALWGLLFGVYYARFSVDVDVVAQGQ